MFYFFDMLCVAVVYVVLLYMCYLCFVFFFQAEDGIRDAQESRGLGDVYKRQDLDAALSGFAALIHGLENDDMSTLFKLYWILLEAVSYTHLTLPTIYSV